MRGTHTSLLLAAFGYASKVVSGLPKSGYIRRTVTQPLGPIGADDSVKALTDDPFFGSIRQRKLHKSSKKSSKSTKTSKSHKSAKSAKVYYVIVNPPPQDNYYEDHWTHYDSHPSYYEYYPDDPTEYPTHAHHETERGGMPSLDASPDEPTPTVPPPAFSPSEDPPPAFSPSEDEPTLSPSITASPTREQCPVSVMLDRCPELLQTIEPEDGCECYNFCNETYIGCCGIDEPCPLSCDVLGGFVAGCQFEPIESASPSEAAPSESPMPTEAETLPPSSSGRPTSTSQPVTQQPSITASPSKTPTVSPSITPVPTADNSTEAPTIQTFPVALDPFTLEYELGQFRPAAQSDLIELTSLTNSYLQSYMLSAFQSEEVLMVDFVTSLVFYQDVSDSSIILVTFDSEALFKESSVVVPTQEEVEAERQQAFEGDSISGYLGMVQSLPSNNVFNTALQIFLVQEASEEQQRSGISGVGVAAASFAALLSSALIGAVMYRQRRKRRRHRASDKFLDGIKEIDVLSAGMTATDSNSGGCSLGTADFEDAERIEVCLCECEEDMEHVAVCMLENDEEEVVFEQEKGYLYQDEDAEGENESDDQHSDGSVEAAEEGSGTPCSSVDECISLCESSIPDPDEEASPLVICASQDSYGFSSLESPPSDYDGDDEDSH